jgi:hypothetical protein
VNFSFRLSRPDLIAFHKVANRRMKEVTGANLRLSVANLIAWIPLGIAILAYVGLYRSYPEATLELSIVVAWAALGLVLVACFFVYKARLTRRAWLSDDGWFLSEQAVDADAEGLSIRTARGNTSFFRWTAFVHRAEDGANLYLFVDNAQAVVIPKSALGSGEDAAQFRAWSGLQAP